jgi:hypothetical protein
VGTLALIWLLWLCRNDLIFNGKNSSSFAGNLPMHFYAPFVVTTTAYGEQRVVYGGVYMVGECGAGYFYPTWLVA